MAASAISSALRSAAIVAVIGLRPLLAMFITAAVEWVMSSPRILSPGADAATVCLLTRASLLGPVIRKSRQVRCWELSIFTYAPKVRLSGEVLLGSRIWKLNPPLFPRSAPKVTVQLPAPRSESSCCAGSIAPLPSAPRIPPVYDVSATCWMSATSALFPWLYTPGITAAVPSATAIAETVEIPVVERRRAAAFFWSDAM